MKILYAILLSLSFPWVAAAEDAVRQLPAIRVHADGHYLETTDGKPFFWLGDTGWKVIHCLSRSDASYYLHTRAQQGFTIVQLMVLDENDGITETNALGQLPFIDSDPTRPNDNFFDRVVEIADEAAADGLYVALLPAWGDQLTAPWGEGPRIFRNDNLPAVHRYAKYLALRLRGRSNVVWMLGGDRPAKLDAASSDQYPNSPGIGAGFAANYDWTPIWRANPGCPSTACKAATAAVTISRCGIGLPRIMRSIPRNRRLIWSRIMRITLITRGRSGIRQPAISATTTRANKLTDLCLPVPVA